MTSPNADQNELGAFLRARRSELSPSDVDLPEGGRQRRVPGLRREEVAQLAAISTDYYTRLEQGRIRPSAAVLASLARVLHLDDDQRTYLFEVAGTEAASARSRRPAPQKIKPHMQRVLGQITDAPAIVMTPTHVSLTRAPRHPRCRAARAAPDDEGRPCPAPRWASAISRTPEAAPPSARERALVDPAEAVEVSLPVLGSHAGALGDNELGAA